MALKSALIKLTPEQVSEMEPLFREVVDAERRSQEQDTEQRMAILGQVWSPTDVVQGHKAGCAKFYLLNTEQWAIVNAAIRQVLQH